MIAILCLSPTALDLARRISAHLPDCEIHGLEGRVETPITFVDTGAHLRRLFTGGHTIVGLCAAGILIRCLSPVLSDKMDEPPVLALSPDGRSIVPLLGGHHGANDLARHLADLLGGQAAITTAGPIALDQPPLGWTIRDPAAAKPVMADLVAGLGVTVLADCGAGNWLDGLDQGGPRHIRVTHRADATGDVVLHPPVLALGVGCDRTCPPQELADLVLTTLARYNLAPQAVAAVGSLDLKMDEAAVNQLADTLGVPARFFSAAQLAEQAPRLKNPSSVVLAETGCPGVAEGAALALAGPDGQLIVEKTKTGRATMAVALAPQPIPHLAGQARGRLWVVGIGPGTDQWRTPQASAAIRASSDLVGYGLYLDLLGDLTQGKTRHQSDLGAEADRARMALDLAGQGREVALVCSGDAGIYALATLVFELIEREANPAWARLDVQVVPGVSALQAAAARAGAPVNHDFCTISLSDLLTPWETIEKRLHAAAQADFVVCFYNPVSKRRRDQLARARDILITGRGGDAPVILARQLGRDGESIDIIALRDLTPDHADMLTLVMVGSSESRVISHAGQRRVYTPRGYAKKL